MSESLLSEAEPEALDRVRASRPRPDADAGPPAPRSYRDQLKQDMAGLIEALALDDLEKRYLRSRWLDQALWMESRAEQARNWYYRLQFATIIGGVSIPTLVSLDQGTGSLPQVAHWVTFSLGLIVALSAALEGFFHFGDRWKQYRRTAELLKAEFWRFSQRSGPYQVAATQRDAFPAFADRVEQIIQRDVEVYFTEVVNKKHDEKPEPNPNPGH